MIGADIKITILEIKGDNIKIGIEAPRETPVYRQEVYHLIQQENQLAARVEKGILANLPNRSER